MKRLLFLFVLTFVSLFAFDLPADAARHSGPSSLERARAKASQCRGCIRIVSSGGDFKVRVDSDLPNLYVQLLDGPRTSYAIGEWLLVDGGEDYTVEFVDDCTKDFTIDYAPIGSLGR